MKQNMNTETIDTSKDSLPTITKRESILREKRRLQKILVEVEQRRALLEPEAFRHVRGIPKRSSTMSDSEELSTRSAGISRLHHTMVAVIRENAVLEPGIEVQDCSLLKLRLIQLDNKLDQCDSRLTQESSESESLTEFSVTTCRG
jgi:hypothetical protein